MIFFPHGCISILKVKKIGLTTNRSILLSSAHIIMIYISFPRTDKSPNTETDSVPHEFITYLGEVCVGDMPNKMLFTTLVWTKENKELNSSPKFAPFSESLAGRRSMIDFVVVSSHP